MNNHQGQGSIEYILLLTVVAVVIISSLRLVKERMIGDGTCPSDAFICNFQDLYSGNGFFEGNFKRFRLRR